MESHLQIPKKKSYQLGYHTFSSEDPGGKRGTAYLWFYGEALAKGGDFFKAHSLLKGRKKLSF